MNGLDGILGTALLAVVVFVAGQALLRFVLEPIQEQRRLIGEVAHALLFYGNAYHPDAFGPASEERRAELEEVSAALRGLAGRLRESLWTVPAYDTLARMGWVRSKANVLTASRELVGWSNNLYGDTTVEDRRYKRRRIIADALGITEKVGPPD